MNTVELAETPGSTAITYSSGCGKSVTLLLLRNEKMLSAFVMRSPRIKARNSVLSGSYSP